MDQRTVTIPLVGDFDMAREAELLHLVRVLDLPSSSVVRLEMSRVTSVDAAGLRGMLAARAFLEDNGSELQVLCPSSQILRVLEVAGLRAVLTILDERG